MSYHVYHGGLMRCCLETIALDSPETPVEGQRLRCRWCSDSDGMVFTEGVWRWGAPLLDMLRQLQRQHHS